jgi:hypothetical protein
MCFYISSYLIRYISSFFIYLLIVHVQSIYNVTKPLTIICIIFVNFCRFFCTGSLKTNVIDFGQNQSGKSAKPINLLVFLSVYRLDSKILTF